MPISTQPTHSDPRTPTIFAIPWPGGLRAYIATPTRSLTPIPAEHQVTAQTLAQAWPFDIPYSGRKNSDRQAAKFLRAKGVPVVLSITNARLSAPPIALPSDGTEAGAP